MCEHAAYGFIQTINSILNLKNKQTNKQKSQNPQYPQSVAL